MAHLAQTNLLIADRLRMPLDLVENLDDDAWVKAAAGARWLEDRQILRMQAAIARAFSSKK